MKIALTICLLSFFSYNLLGQDCSCQKQLSDVIRYFEENNPAFQKIRKDRKEYKDYRKAVEALKLSSSTVKGPDACLVYLDRYVSLLKDHHSGIGFNLKRIDLGTDQQIADFKASDAYKQFKKINIDTSAIISVMSKKETGDIEGIYSDGRATRFAIIREDKKPNSFIGVVLRANKLLDIGHVLLELKQKPDRTYDVMYNVGLLGFNFRYVFRNMNIENGQLPNFGFSKLTAGKLNEKEYEFRELDSAANYLRLHSFDYRLKSELDSFYASIDQQIRSKPFLVIDLRNNGGGSEASYFNLLPYAYTGPLQIDPAYVWVSPDNIRRYEESEQQNKVLIERMKAAPPFTFIPQVEEGQDTWTLDSATVFPRKIALLYNKGTASSAEGMILYYMQSDKVITIGENSGGYIGYGNVMSARLPCGDFTVQSTTTKYLEKSKYEFVGIEPAYKPSMNVDWISYALQLLKKAN